MSLLGKITTLFADKNSTQPLFPRTVTKAITNEKGEVLDDIMASKSDLPIVCNRNLLDNWYFGNPVNQRGQNSYTTKAYSLDRWYLGDGSLEVASEKIKIQKGWLAQRFGNLEFTDKNLTLSILTADNELFYWSFKFHYDGSWNSLESVVAPWLVFRAQRDDTEGQWRIVFDTMAAAPDAEKYILAAKLELGSHQTLAHQEGGVWVLNEIPNFAEELQKCQRYQYILDTSIIWANIAMIFNKHQALFGSFTFPVTLRTFPTVYELGAEGEAKKIFHLRDYWGGNLISIGIEDNTVNNIWASRDTFSGIYRIETGVEELVEGDQYSFTKPVIFDANL